MSDHDNSPGNAQKVHIVSYKEHASTFVALVLLTIMTVTISVYGADLYTLTVLTALAIASTKATVVGWYFMHLKYESRLFMVMIAGVLILFLTFLVFTVADYATRN